MLTRDKKIRLTGFQTIVLIWVGIALVVIIGLVFGPEREPPPPTSEVSYEPRSPEREDDDLPPMDIDWGTERDRKPAAGRSKPAKDSVRLVGMVIDADTDEPVAGAQLTARRQVSPAELEAFRQGGSVSDRLDVRKNSRTTKQGKFVISGLVPGTYVVDVRAYRYMPKSEMATIEEGAKETTITIMLSHGSSIAGRIREEGTNQPARGVYVYASVPGSSRSGVYSDADGEYILGGLKAGDHIVRIETRDTDYRILPGAQERDVRLAALAEDLGQPVERTVSRDASRGGREQLVTVGENEDVRGVDFLVGIAGQVWGYALDPERKPIKGVTVFLCTSASPVSQLIDMALEAREPRGDATDSDGLYIIRSVELNQQWQVFAMENDWSPQISEPFFLSPTQRAVRVDIFLTRGSNVYGRVVDTARQPVSGAELACIPKYSKFLSPLDAPAAVRQEHSDNEGNFEITSLPAGEYQILAMKQGYKIAFRGEPIYPDGYHDITGIEIMLTRVGEGFGEYTIYGRIYDSRDQPIPEANVALTSVSAGELAVSAREQKSDNYGRFRFENAELGIYSLIVNKKGYVEKVVTDVRLNEPTDVYLERQNAISGVVLVRETGAPPPRYQVRLIPAASRRSDIMDTFRMFDWRSFSDPEGKFRINASGHGDFIVEARATKLTPGKVSVHVPEDRDVDGVRVYVSSRGGRIRGKTVDATGLAVPGAIVEISQMDEIALAQFIPRGLPGFRPSQQSDEEGKFEFDALATGDYFLGAKYKGYADARVGPISVSEGRTVSNITIVLTQGGRLTGFVPGDDGRPLEGAVVTIAGGPNYSAFTTSGRGGEYTFESLPPGEYLISAISLDIENLAGLFAPKHGMVVIREGETTVYNFETTVGTSIAGAIDGVPGFPSINYVVLRMPGSQSVTGVDLRNPASWFTEGSMAANFIVGASPIGSDGTFNIPNVPDGNYTLEVVSMSLADLVGGGGQSLHEQDVQIAADTPLNLDIDVGGL